MPARAYLYEYYDVFRCARTHSTRALEKVRTGLTYPALFAQ